MKAGIVTFVACLLVVSTLYMLADGVFAAENPENVKSWAPRDVMEMLKVLKENSYREGEKISRSNADFETFSYEDGPYPMFKDDGSLGDVQPLSGDWGDHYVSDIMYRPPNNPGGGYSMDATGGAGNFAVGDTHESFIGDQNGNGILEWIAFFSYRPWGMDGIDNDGDGCVDEKTYSDWDGQVGCDMVPDQFSFLEIGGLPDVGGKDGTLAATNDWYSANPGVRLHRIFAMPPGTSYTIPGLKIYYTEIVNNEDFISYHARESDNGVNANPELDNDQDDWYMGSLDARGFPSVPPTAHVCFAGYPFYTGRSALRDDGYVVTSFELHEQYDDRDWNGDGDKEDHVAAYYVVDPATGKCDQGVNGGVYGWYPTNSGEVMTPGYTFESRDNRDWNGDGDKSDTVLLWHDIDSTWSLIGHRYTSFTFTSTPGPFGFGFWGRYSDYVQTRIFPLKFGGTFYKNLGSSQGYYHTYFWLTDDEDGDPQTVLPHHHVGYGFPGDTLAQVCIRIYERENYLKYAGVKLVGGKADGNGDGDTIDVLNAIYCPNEKGGGGNFWVEPTSKFVKGLYEDAQPWIWAGYFFYGSSGDANGLVIVPSFYDEREIYDDADGNLKVESVLYHVYYWITFEKTDIKIVDSEWIGDTAVQPGGTVIGKISILNYGGSSLYLSEDWSLIDIGAYYKVQGLYLEDLGNGDGILDPGEIVSIYFSLRLSSGVPIGPLTVTIHIGHVMAFLETDMTLQVYLKMQGNDLACYRHRQNALRAIRAFDMDDDMGRLHHLIQGKYVNLKKYGVGKMKPEEAVFQLIKWYEEGCKVKGKGGVELAHSAGMRLTGKYGMGISYWGFNPGQEEGNEGNGNGGLTGASRKDVYGI